METTTLIVPQGSGECKMLFSSGSVTVEPARGPWHTMSWDRPLDGIGNPASRLIQDMNGRELVRRRVDVHAGP